MYFVYAIVSLVDHRIYVGMTSNIKNRLHEHNAGRTKSTRPYAPWKLFYFEKFETRDLVRAREKYLKSGIGKERLKAKLKVWRNSD